MDTGFQRNVINYMLEQTITGSIGVFGLLPNLKKMASEHSVYWDAVKTHDHSDIMTIARPKTEAELQVIQEYANGIYQKFIGLLLMPEKSIPRGSIESQREGFGPAWMRRGWAWLMGLVV